MSKLDIHPPVIVADYGLVGEGRGRLHHPEGAGPRPPRRDRPGLRPRHGRRGVARAARQAHRRVAERRSPGVIVGTAPMEVLSRVRRRGRDSNPGSDRSDGGFQDRCNRPLCHPSGDPLLVAGDTWRVRPSPTASEGGRHTAPGVAYPPSLAPSGLDGPATLSPAEYTLVSCPAAQEVPRVHSVFRYSITAMPLLLGQLVAVGVAAVAAARLAACRRPCGTRRRRASARPPVASSTSHLPADLRRVVGVAVGAKRAREDLGPAPSS